MVQNRRKSMISTFGWIVIYFVLLIIKYACLQSMERNKQFSQNRGVTDD